MGSLVFGFLIWGVVVLGCVLVFAVFAGKFYFPGILGFESKSRKRIVKLGLGTIILGISFLLLLPVLVVNIVTPQAQEVSFDGSGNNASFIVKTIACFGAGAWGRLSLVIGAVIAAAFVVLVFVILFAMREQERRSESKSSRTHVFELDEGSFEKMNVGKF